MTRASPQNGQAGPGRPRSGGEQGSLALLLLPLYTFLGHPRPFGRPIPPAVLPISFDSNRSATGEGTEALRLEPNTSAERQGEGEGEDNGDRGAPDDGQGDRVGFLEEVLNLLGWEDRWVVRVEPRAGALGHWVGQAGRAPDAWVRDRPRPTGPAGLAQRFTQPKRKMGAALHPAVLGVLEEQTGALPQPRSHQAHPEVLTVQRGGTVGRCWAGRCWGRSIRERYWASHGGKTRLPEELRSRGSPESGQEYCSGGREAAWAKARRLEGAWGVVIQLGRKETGEGAPLALLRT